MGSKEEYKQNGQDTDSPKLQQQPGQGASDQELCNEIGIMMEKLFKPLGPIKPLSIGSFHEIPKKYDVHTQNTVSLINYYPGSDSNRPPIVFEREELVNILAEAIDLLTLKERLVISLYYLADLNMEDIGEVLRLDEYRVWQLHTMAIMKLRLKLKDHTHLPG